MVEKNKIIIGILTFLLVSSGIVYVTFSDQARIRVDGDKTTFYVPHEEYHWIWSVAGREQNKLFDGTSLMYRDLKSIKVNTHFDENNKSRIIRETTYIRGPKIVDTYYFDGNINNIELFPIRHKIEIFNASGKFYRYESRDLEYSGDTYKLNNETELYFGKNMKIELQENYRWAWIYKSGIVKAQYDINSDYEVFDIRLFDPPISDYTIKDNSVYMNDSRAYISATPHTLTKSGYVENTIKSKTYTGKINVLWGFNTSKTKPKDARIYNPINKTWNESFEYDIYNVTSITTTEEECDFGKSYNKIHREVSYLGINGTNETTNVFCFDSYEQEGNDYRLYWETKNWKMTYWQDISGELEKIEYDLNGKDTWYYAQNVSIQAGQSYKVRSYINVRPNSNGKYDFAVYPSSYGLTEQGILDAYNDGNLYLLDPWWNSSYDERYTHDDNSSGWTGIGYFGANLTGEYSIIGGDSDTGTAYTYNDTDTGDLINANDTTELCRYNTETGDVNCPLLTGSAEGMVVHYPLDGSSGDVWSPINESLNGTNSGTTRNVTGKINKGFDFDGSNDYVSIPTTNYGYGSSQELSVNLWFKTTSSQQQQMIDFGGEAGEAFESFLIQTNPKIKIRITNKHSTSLNVRVDLESTNDYNDGNFHMVTLVADGTNDIFYLYIDGEHIKNASFTFSLFESTRNNYISSLNAEERFFDGVMDEVRLWDRALSSTEISNLYNSTNTKLPYWNASETSFNPDDYETKYPHNDNGSGYNEIGYFGANQTGWYGIINNSDNGQVYTYNDTDTGDMIVGDNTNELCWFDTETGQSGGLSTCESSLIALYPLDGSSGDVWSPINESLNGTNNGATRDATGKINKAFDFDGSNDYIGLSNTTGNDEKSISVSAWVKINELGNTYAIVDKSGDGFDNRDWSLKIKDNNTAFFGVWVIDGYWAYSNDTLSADTWYLLTGTYNDSTNKVRIYIDGNLSREETHDVVRSQTTVPTNIGRKGNASSNWQYFNGSIDHVQIWEKELTSSEISNMYDSQSTKLPYWNANVVDDVCTCPGTDANWEIDMSNYCNITSNCDLGTGNITWTNNGATLFNATINAKNMEYPSTNQKLNIGSNGLVYIG